MKKQHLVRGIAVVLMLAMALTLGVQPKAAAAEPVYTVSGTDYTIRTGSISYHTTESNEDLGGLYNITNCNMEIDSAYYLSDGYFMESATDYNTHLATASVVLSASARKKDAGVSKTLLEQMGFSTVSSPDYCTIASRALVKANGEGTGKKLVAVVVRSGENGMAETSTYNMGSSGDHTGFTAVANTVKSAVDSYVSTNCSGDNVVYWVVGYSHSGSVANLTAKQLLDAGKSVFCYTVGAAKGGTGSGTYAAIHNIVNSTDFATWLAGTQYGFKRYGTDHSIDTTMTGAEYVSQMNSVKPGFTLPTQSHWAYMSFEISIESLIGLIGKDSFELKDFFETTDVAVDSATYYNDLLKNLLADNASYKWAGSRSNYNSETFANESSFPGSTGVTLQTALTSLLDMYNNLTPQQQYNLVKVFENVTDAVTTDYKNNMGDRTSSFKGSLTHSYRDGWIKELLNWNHPATYELGVFKKTSYTHPTDSDKIEIISYVWDRLMESSYEKGGTTYTVKSILGETALANFKKCVPVLLNAGIRILMRDYDQEYPGGDPSYKNRMCILSTIVMDIMENDGALFNGTDISIYLAAVRAEDTFYQANAASYKWDGENCTAKITSKGNANIVIAE